MHDEGSEERRAWIILGGIHLLNRTSPRRSVDPIVLVRVRPQEVSVPAATVVIQWDLLGMCHLDALTANGDRLGEARIEGGALFPDAMAGTTLRKLTGTAAPGLVPLCYLAEHPTGGYHAYAQIRFHAEDACFVRSTPEPVGAGPVEALRWLNPMLSAHAAASAELNNHRRYYRTHHAGTELEYKYTLDPQPNIWSEAVELLKVLGDGELEGCQPEYRDSFQINDTQNHMFDVTGPATEIGYASFIPTVTAGPVLKRKWFERDAFARREELLTGIDVGPDGFEQYLRTELGLEVQALPPFRRVRYDVHCESLRTGHIYGIFFDRCSLLTAPDMVLSQCELEYRRSRGILTTEDEVLSEMERINHWLQHHLAARGWSTNPTFYSKRTFLREVVTAMPELAV